MAPGASNRNTGTVPKVKTRNNNDVPQEIVNPRRRDIHDMNVLSDWTLPGTTTVSAVALGNNQNQNHNNVVPQNNHISNNIHSNSNQSHIKPQNRTPGEGTCYEIENNRFIPVRPILRRNDDLTNNIEQHSNNTAVVLPTAPIFNNNTDNHNNYTQHNHHRASIGSPLSVRIPDGSSTPQVTKNQAASNRNRKNNIEERLNQIQEYIQITTSLINSVEGEQRFGEDFENLLKSHEELKLREKLLKEIIAQENPSEMSQPESDKFFQPINSASLDDLTVSSDIESGPRAQSVQSIHTESSAATTPVNTPSMDDLKSKLEAQNRHIQSLKDQQLQLQRMQQAAKQHLEDMERARGLAPVADFNNVESVEQAENNVANLNSRMSAVSNMINSQNELVNLMGGADDDDIVAEQMALQNKLRELKNKKAQMEQLVQDLQNINNLQNINSMNDEATQGFTENDLTPTRIVPVDAERIVPISMSNAPSRRPQKNKPLPQMNHVVNGSSSDAESVQDAAEADMNNEQSQAEGGALSDKISEINKMKDQLQRLKDLMNTVTLIENKVGPIEDEDEEDAIESEPSRSPSVASQISGSGQRREQVIPEREKNTDSSAAAHALNAMTESIKEQARAIALEKERLATARQAVNRRNQELNQVQAEAGRAPKPVIPPRAPSPGVKEKKQMALKAELEAKKKELDKIEALMAQSKRARDAVKIYPIGNNTPPEPPVRTRFSTPPQQVPQNHIKESLDSTANDLYSAPLEASSAPSDSTRSLHTVPPMPDLRTNWKRPQESIGSSAHDFVPSSQYSPWLPHFNGPPSSNAGPQSPSFGYMGSDHLGFNPFSFHMPSSAINGSDPLVIQNFMQTQQMLMNSINQCHQLLWMHQREINNLNNAVLLLQERLLNSNSSNLLQQQQQQENLNSLHSMRAESTPPTLSALNQQSAAFNRARSEQPLNLSMPLLPPQSYHVPNLAPLYQQQQQQQQSSATNSFQQNITHSQSSATSQQIQRNNHAINMNMNNRNLARNMRSASVSTQATNNVNTIYEQQQAQQQTQQQVHNHQQPNNASANCYFQNAEQVQANSFMNLNNQFDSNDLETNLLNIRQNNVSSNSTTNSNLTYQNLLNNNQMYQQGPNQPPMPPMSNVSPQHQQATLNNQVPPGMRANNYWDNFRSYSRQNLLSSNSCKSNEDNHHHHYHHHVQNVERLPQNMTRNINHNTNNNENVSNQHNKYPFTTSRNNANNVVQQQQQQQSQQQLHQQINSLDMNLEPGLSSGNNHHDPPFNFQNLAMPGTSSGTGSGATAGQHQPLNQSNSLDLGELQFHTNPINLGVNEFNSKSKTLPKGSGNKKYSIPLRSRDCNSLEGAVGGENHNLRSSQFQDPKSTSKLFEALKENVYTEVTNLITANESRPHFLIQLFRELQLISSDPLRQRTIQSIQELYNRYVESSNIIQEETAMNNHGLNNIVTPFNSNGSPRPHSGPHNGSSGPLQREVLSFNYGPSPRLNQADSDTGVVSSSSANTQMVAPLSSGPITDGPNVDFEISPEARSTPRGSNSHSMNCNRRSSSHSGVGATAPAVATSPDADFINAIMNEIISAVHAVDYINDSILQKVTNIVFHHVSDEANISGNGGGGAGGQGNAHNRASRLIINNDDFLRHLNHWNRTDKDEFITNLENYLNNILVECSNVVANAPSTSSYSGVSSSGIVGSTSGGTGGGGVNVVEVDDADNELSIDESGPSSNYNGFAIFVDGDLAEADQVCSNDENIEELANHEDGVVMVAGASGGQNLSQGYDRANSEVLMEDEDGSWNTPQPVVNNSNDDQHHSHSHHSNNNNNTM